MSALAKLRGAWGACLFVHGWKTLASIAIVLPIVGAVAGPELSTRAAVAEWVAAMRVAVALGSGSRWLALPLMASVVISPWLGLAWLRALDRGGDFKTHARWALGRYRLGCSLWLFTAAYLGALLALSALLVRAVRSALAGWHDARLTDSCVLIALCPLLLAALHALTVHDAAGAALARGCARLRPALAHGFATASWRRVGARGALVLAQGLVGSLAWAAPRYAWGAGGIADVSLVLLTQAVALGFTLARAAWLAWVLTWSEERAAVE